MPESRRSRSRTGGIAAMARGTSVPGSVCSTGKLTCWRGKPSRKLQSARQAPDYGEFGDDGDSVGLGAGDGVAVTAGAGVATAGLGAADGDWVTGDTAGEADRVTTADRDGAGTRPAGSWSTVPPVNDVPDPADRVTTADNGLAAASSTPMIVAADRARTMIPVAAMARYGTLTRRRDAVGR